MNRHQLETEKYPKFKEKVEANDLSGLINLIGSDKIMPRHMFIAIDQNKLEIFNYLYNRCKKEDVELLNETNAPLLMKVINNNNDVFFNHLVENLGVNTTEGLHTAIQCRSEKYVEKLLSKGIQLDSNNHQLLRKACHSINSQSGKKNLIVIYIIYFRQKKEDIALDIINEELNNKKFSNNDIKYIKTAIAELHQEAKEVREKENLNQKLQEALIESSNIAKPKL